GLGRSGSDQFDDRERRGDGVAAVVQPPNGPCYAHWGKRRHIRKGVGGDSGVVLRQENIGARVSALVRSHAVTTGHHKGKPGQYSPYHRALLHKTSIAERKVPTHRTSLPKARLHLNAFSFWTVLRYEQWHLICTDFAVHFTRPT